MTILECHTKVPRQSNKREITTSGQECLPLDAALGNSQPHNSQPNGHKTCFIWGSYPCLCCPIKPFLMPSQLDSHLTTTHKLKMEEGAKLKEDVGNKLFSLDEVQDQLNNKDNDNCLAGNPGFGCSICKSRYDNFTEFESHLVIRHKLKPHVKLIKHQHSVDFHSNLASIGLDQIHINTESNTENIGVEKDKEMRDSDRLYDKNVNLESCEELPCCKICNEEFENSFALSAHIATHCRSIPSSHLMVKGDMKRNVSKNDIENFKYTQFTKHNCVKCKKPFQNIDHLQEHFMECITKDWNSNIP